MSYVDKIVKSCNRLVRIYRAKVNGACSWFIIRVHRDKLPIYLRDVQHKATINLPDYGEVLHSGWGESPPAYLIYRLTGEYNPQ